MEGFNILQQMTTNNCNYSFEINYSNTSSKNWRSENHEGITFIADV